MRRLYLKLLKEGEKYNENPKSEIRNPKLFKSMVDDNFAADLFLYQTKGGGLEGGFPDLFADLFLGLSLSCVCDRFYYPICADRWHPDRRGKWK